MCRWKGIFLVSPLDSRCSSDNISGIFRHIVHNLLANDGDPFNGPPTQAGVLHIVFLKLGQGIINFYQFCAVGKNLKAQCKEQEVPMQFILYPVTSNPP